MKRRLCKRTARILIRAVRKRQREVEEAIRANPEAFTLTDRLDNIDEAERVIMELMGWTWPELAD